MQVRGSRPHTGPTGPDHATRDSGPHSVLKRRPSSSSLLHINPNRRKWQPRRNPQSNARKDGIFFPRWGSDVCPPQASPAQTAAEWKSGRASRVHLGQLKIFQGKPEPSEGQKGPAACRAPGPPHPPAEPHCPLLSASSHSCTGGCWSPRAGTRDSAGVGMGGHAGARAAGAGPKRPGQKVQKRKLLPPSGLIRKRDPRLMDMPRRSSFPASARGRIRKS